MADCNTAHTSFFSLLLTDRRGPNGPSRPLPVEDGLVATQITPAQMRISYETLSQHLDKTQKVWVYSYRFNSTADWMPVYCFTDVEFFPEDIAAMNFEPWLDKQTFFTHKVVCVRFGTNNERSEAPGSPDTTTLEAAEIDSTLTVNHDVFKWRRNGKKVIELQLKNEEERVDVFRHYFGIELSEEDQESILGTAAQIGSTAMGTTEHT